MTGHANSHRSASLKCVALFTLMIALDVRALHACPFCRSDTAAQVRARLFNSDFVWNLSVVAAPFYVLAALLLILAVWPESYRYRKRDDHE